MAGIQATKGQWVLLIFSYQKYVLLYYIYYDYDYLGNRLRKGVTDNNWTPIVLLIEKHIESMLKFYLFVLTNCTIEENVFCKF